MTETRMEFTIYMDSWLRGEKDSVLHRARDGKECCLGQILCQSGMDFKRLVGVRTPAELRRIPAKIRELLVESADYCTNLGDHAMGVNDDKMSDAKRINKLKALFKTAGVKLRFVKGVAPWLKDVQP